MSVNLKNITLLGANPGSGYWNELLSSAGTGEIATFIVPSTSLDVGITLKALSTAVAKIEVTESPIDAINADTAIWKDGPAALVGITSGAVGQAIVPGPIQAFRVNITTALAGNQVTLQAQVRNNLY